MLPDERVPLMVHSPTVDGPTEVLNELSAATCATKAATALALSQPTLWIAAFQL